MGAAYSQDLRDRVIAARDRGMRTKQVADLFRVSASWVRRVMQRRREHQQTSPRPRGGVTVIKIDMERLRQLVAEQPDATTKQLHARLGVDCSISAVDMALRRAGLTFKKKRRARRSRIGPMSPNDAPHGSGSSPKVTRSDGSSSMRRGARRT
jgi:transposase